MNRPKKSKSLLKIIFNKARIVYSKIVEKELVNQEVIKKFNENIDNIYADDGLPESAKIIKMAKLLENNPEVPKKIDGVIELIERLNSKNRYKKHLLSDNIDNSKEKD